MSGAEASTRPAHVHGHHPIVMGDAQGIGAAIDRADAAVVLVHGRGGTAVDILGLATELGAPDIAYVAPQATGNTWYPQSFLAPIEANEPGLSSGLRRLDETIELLNAAGIPRRRILLLGFSQGACLTAEFVARSGREWGGVAILSGGLIGPPGGLSTDRPDTPGDLAGTPIFLGCSDVDPHVPLARVRESAAAFRRLGADVEARIYPGLPHTIIEDELAWFRARLQAVAPVEG